MGMTLTCNEMLDVFQNAFCNKSYLIVVCNFEFCTSIIGMDEPKVNIDYEFIHISDINDVSFKIKKRYVSNIIITEQDFGCEVKIDFGNGNITFIICE